MRMYLLWFEVRAIEFACLWDSGWLDLRWYRFCGGRWVSWLVWGWQLLDLRWESVWGWYCDRQVQQSGRDDFIFQCLEILIEGYSLISRCGPYNRAHIPLWYIMVKSFCSAEYPRNWCDLAHRTRGLFELGVKFCVGRRFSFFHRLASYKAKTWHT